MSSYNFPLLSLPAYYALTFVPHAVAAGIVTQHLKTYDNRNPKSEQWLAKIKAKLPPRAYAKWERAESCHRNALENLPLFIAAVLAGVYAEKETGVSLDSSWYAGAFLIIRTLYTVAYINTETQPFTLVRSSLYIAGVAVCSTLIIKAAKAIGA